MSTQIATVQTALDRLNKSLAKTSLDEFVNARTRRSLLLVDCSGSMDTRLSATGERRIDALRKVVADIRQDHPVPVAAFGRLRGRVLVEVVESIPEPSGTTPLDTAIEFGQAQGATHLVVVTDGEPNSESAAIAAAQRFGGPIDVFFVGDPNTHGAAFAARLAALTGGTSGVSDLGKPKELAGKIVGLLGDGTN
jgi:Mg-chelatase subunit ChlD